MCRLVFIIGNDYMLNRVLQNRKVNQRRPENILRKSICYCLLTDSEELYGLLQLNLDFYFQLLYFELSYKNVSSPKGVRQ